MKRSLFVARHPRLTLRNEADEPELLLYDEVGWFGVRAKEFVAQLKEIDAKRLHLRINSPGGDVMDGVAIYNALRAHPAEVIVHVDALAASIASLIALAGDQVLIAENAFIMVHNAWGVTIGNADDHRATANILDKIDEKQLIAAFVAKTAKSAAEVRSWMAAETWFDAEQAEAAGLVDGIEGQADAKADFDLSVYRHAPAALAASAGEPTVRDLEKALRDAGLSRTAAKAVLASGSKALESQRDAGDDGLLESGRRLAALLRS